MIYLPKYVIPLCYIFYFVFSALFSRREFIRTAIDEKHIAAAAITGLIIPHAATGTQIAL